MPEYFHFEVTNKLRSGEREPRVHYGMNYVRADADSVIRRYKNRDLIKLERDKSTLSPSVSKVPRADVGRIRVARTESPIGILTQNEDVFADEEIVATFGEEYLRPDSPWPPGPRQPLPPPTVDEKPAQDQSLDSRRVMVVHGRNSGARDAMFDFLRALDVRPQEWSSLITLTGSGAPFIGDVLNEAFRSAAAVIVLLTPDDEARLREPWRGENEPAYETELTPQARPNVLFEAGMALASHPERTVLVQVGDLRPFSDVYGRHVVRLDGTEKPLRDIARRLQAAGCAVDMSGDDWARSDRFG
jgi:predicted nucleotide-binding protein